MYTEDLGIKDYDPKSLGRYKLLFRGLERLTAVQFKKGRRNGDRGRWKRVSYNREEARRFRFIISPGRVGGTPKYEESSDSESDAD